jgi:sodium/hydrogen antiporter
VLAALKRSRPLQFEEFIVLGVIALSYGMARVVEAYGFIAVFAAGVALSHGERQWRARPAPTLHDGHASAEADPVIAPRLLALTEQFERLAEVALVLTVGALLAHVRVSVSLLLFAALVLLVARPLTVLAVVSLRNTGVQERRLLAWFGVRGIGSVYYLAYALNHGVPAVAGDWLLEAVAVTITLSIVLHDISATPLMARYQRGRHPAC